MNPAPIAHIALWTCRLDELRDFYVRYFGGECGEKYVNPAKGFESYMIRFGDGCALELMRRTDITAPRMERQLGLCHLAFGYAGRKEVLEQTELLRNAGFRVTGEPRITGDGYFESVVADPDGNPIELTCQAI